MLAALITTLLSLPAPDTWDQVAQHYRRGSFGEKISYHAAGANTDRSSTVVLRVSHEGPNAPVIRLDLGNLIIWADNTRLVASHAGNPKAYFEQTLTGGLTADALQSTLPPLVMPQLGWAVSKDAPAEGWWNCMGVGQVHVGESRTEGAVIPLDVTDVRGPAHVDALTVRRDATGLALDTLTLTYPGEPATTLEVRADGLQSSELGGSSTWGVDTAGRTRVERLTDLKPIPGEVTVGESSPPLSLFTGQVVGWSFADAVRQLRALNPQPPGPAWIVLLVEAPEAAPAHAGVVAQAARGLDALVREFSIQRMQGVRNAPRLEGHEVAVLELGEVNAQRVAELAKARTPGTDSLGERLVSTAGRDAFHRVAPGAAAAIIVLDEQQRVAGVVRLDGRMVDAETISQEVRRTISTREEPENKPPAQDSAGDGGH
ncbi:MAG: hypothetical protein U0637_07960 [Phycisphaerales bacterium]